MVRHRYEKVGDFWLPAENHSKSLIRMGGQAVLSIEYKEYKINEAATVPFSTEVAEKSKAVLALAD